MDTSKIQSGDTGFFQGTAFISKAIISFMEEYRKNWIIDPDILKLLNGFIPSHAGTFYRDKGVLYLYGSIEAGYKRVDFDNSEYVNEKYLVLRDVQMTPAIAQVGFNYATNAVNSSTGYPYYAIPMWALYIQTDWKWLLSWGSHRSEVCYKSAYENKRAMLPGIYALNANWVTFFDCIKPNNQIIIDNRK